jgi:hypothetical protein
MGLGPEGFPRSSGGGRGNRQLAGRSWPFGSRNVAECKQVLPDVSARPKCGCPGAPPCLCRPFVNELLQKYFALPKFGNGVCVAHPGSTRRGDLEVVLIASRACGGRGSVGMRGAGRAGSPCESVTACRRTALLGFVSPVSFAAPSTGLERLRRKGGPCVRQNRVVLAVVATVKPDRRCARAQPGGRHRQFERRGRPEGKFGSRESTA